MDIKTLEALGLNVESLGDKIIEQAVYQLLNYSGFDPDSDIETRYESRFKKEIGERIQRAVDTKIAALAAEHLLPRVGELIESADMRKTNTWGEPTSPPMTFKQYLGHRAEAYMTEEVDCNGKSKEEASGGYGWTKSGPRLTVLMKLYIKESMEKAARAAVNDVNKALAKSLETAARDAIHATAANLKIAIST